MMGVKIRVKWLLCEETDENLISMLESAKKYDTILFEAETPTLSQNNTPRRSDGIDPYSLS